MLNFNFKVLGTKPDKRSTIYVSFRFGRNDKLMYRTPLKIEPKYWNFQQEKVRKTAFFRGSALLTNTLQLLEKTLTDYITESAINGVQITSEGLKNVLDVHFKKKIPVEEEQDEVVIKEGMDFHAFYESYIKRCKTRMNEKRGGQRISYFTMREYAKTYEYIKDFERSEGIHIEFDDVNQTLVDSFVTYLQGLNLATNTIGHKITCIKAVMKRAYELDLTTNNKYQFIKKQTEESDSVALSKDELQQILELDLSKDSRLARTRDRFLVECYTGLRFADVGRLRRENIADDGRLIKITQSKTNNDVYIPLHPLVKEILEKYDYSLPKISNQKFNKYIKEVCRLAKIDKPFLKSITRGGRKVTTVYQKWQVVSSHTARRSFATNLHLAGYNSLDIMAITGHKSESSFLKYIKVSKAEHAEQLVGFWLK